MTIVLTITDLIALGCFGLAFLFYAIAILVGIYERRKARKNYIMKDMSWLKKSEEDKK